MAEAHLMNQDSDKEIEILLRRSARRGASIMSGAMEDVRAKPEAARNEAHMDADELSAYAEGALPERARSRYSAHLADCDSCRRIVTELVVSSNVASKIEAEEGGTVAQTVVEPRISWREWFASLFSPPVLRFAAPALALLIVTAIIFIVVTRRSSEETSLVAKNEPARSQPANSSGTDQSKEASSNTATESSEDHGNSSTANPHAIEAKPGAAAQQTQPAETSAAAPPTQPQQEAAVAANAPKPAAVSDASPVTEERKADAQPMATTAPSDKVSDRGKAKDEALAIQRERNEEATGGAATATSGAPAPGRRSRSNAETANKSALGAASETADAAKQRNQPSKSLPESRARRDAAGAEVDSTSSSTRTVAGKRFRQQNGVWVDVTYNSSRSLTTVRRGTEQYRALAADEPIIATVAGELGNCIIVIKGRAYHVY